MMYRLAADLVLIVHAGFIAFVILGLVLVWVGEFFRWSWTRGWIFRGAHLACIAFVIAQAWLGILCPLTVLENHYRVLAGQQPYEDAGFIAYWLHHLIFFRAPGWVFAIVYTAFGLIVIATLIFAPPALRRAKTPAVEAA